MSFTINPEDAVNRRQAAAPIGAGLGVTGGSRGVNIDETKVGAKQGSDLMAVLKFSGKAMEGKLRDRQEKAFLDGMSQAAQGVAAADLARERPEWAQAFGDDAATMGARAYEKVADSADLHTQITEAMPEFKRLPPAEFKEQVFKLLEARKTGDEMRDGVLLQATLGWLPQAMVGHAKAHHGWVQEQAIAADLQMKDSVVTAYEAQAAAAAKDPKNSDPAALATAREGVLQIMKPLPGVNEKEHSKRLVAVVRDTVSRGGFATWQAMKDSGALESLDPDSVRMLQNTAREAAAKYLPERVPDAALAGWRDIRLNNQRKPEQITAMVAALNDQVVKATGITDRPFITKAMVDDVIYRGAVETRQEAERRQREAAQDAKSEARVRASEARQDARAAAREAAKEHEELGRQALVAATVSMNLKNWAASGSRSGGMGAAVQDAVQGMPKATERRDAIIADHFNKALKAEDPAAIAQLVDGYGKSYVPESIRTHFSAAFDGPQPDLNSLAALRAMTPFARAAVLGPAGQSAMAQFDGILRAGGYDSMPDRANADKLLATAYDRARVNMKLNPGGERDVSQKLIDHVSEKLDVSIGKVNPALVAHVNSLVPVMEGREDAVAGMVSGFAVVHDGVLIHKDLRDPKAEAGMQAILAAGGSGIGVHIESILDSRNIDTDDVEFIVQEGSNLVVHLPNFQSIVITAEQLHKAAAPKGPSTPSEIPVSP